MSPLVIAVVNAATGIAVLPLVFSLFKTKYDWFEVVLASVAAAVVSLIPNIGGPASLAAMIVVLYWRLPDHLVPDIVVAVGASRLVAFLALLAFKLKGQ